MLELGIVLAAGVLVLFYYNRIVALGARCDQAFADIDVQLKQRHDLIPNLVHTVRDFVGLERASLDALLQARIEAVNAAKPDVRLKAEKVLSSQLTQFISVMSTNPQLQSSAHFVALREEIADTENKIAAARRYLNLSVSEHNATLGQFPLNLLAKPFSLSAKGFFDLGADRVFLEDAPSAKL